MSSSQVSSYAMRVCGGDDDDHDGDGDGGIEDDKIYSNANIGCLFSIFFQKSRKNFHLYLQIVEIEHNPEKIWFVVFTPIDLYCKLNKKCYK